MTERAGPGKKTTYEVRFGFSPPVDTVEVPHDRCLPIHQRCTRSRPCHHAFKQHIIQPIRPAAFSSAVRTAGNAASGPGPTSALNVCPAGWNQPAAGFGTAAFAQA